MVDDYFWEEGLERGLAQSFLVTEGVEILRFAQDDLVGSLKVIVRLAIFLSLRALRSFASLRMTWWVR